MRKYKGVFLIEDFLEKNPDVDIVAALIYSYDDVVDEIHHLNRINKPVTADVFNVYSRAWRWHEFVGEMKRSWANGEHCGDCTKTPCPGARCQVEDYTVQAMDFMRRYRAGSVALPAGP